MTNSSFYAMDFGAAMAQAEAERAELANLRQAFDRMGQATLAIFTVIAVTEPGRAVLSGSPALEVSVPAEAKVGSQVRVVGGEKKNAWTVLPAPIAFGEVVEVVSVEGKEIVGRRGQTEAMFVVADGLELKAGDRTALDMSGSVAMKRLPRADAHRFQLETPQTITWDDIGGQEEAKEALREAIEYPVRFAETYKAHGQKPAKGALLFGPPGCGKTLLARALAASVKAGFLYVKGAEVLDKFVGASEANIRGLFQQARAFKAKTGRAAVIFFDEADAVLSERKSGGLAFAGVDRTLVSTFLAEMDGLDDAAAFVLLATNKPDQLDPAVVREGRCDAKVKVARPDQKSADAIFRLALRGRRGDPDKLAPFGVEALYADTLRLFELSYKGVAMPEYIRLRDLASGAMIEGIVQKAARLAIKRDRESGKLSNITEADLTASVQLTARQQARLNHNDVIAEISAPFGRSPEKVRKLIDDAPKPQAG